MNRSDVWDEGKGKPRMPPWFLAYVTMQVVPLLGWRSRLEKETIGRKVMSNSGAC